MRYYFDFQDHYRVTDKRGEVCTTLNDAKQFAHVLAKELSKSSQASSIAAESVVVLDESGFEVYRTPLMALNDASAGLGTPAT